MEVKEKNLNPETEVEHSKKKGTKWRRKKKIPTDIFFQQLEKNPNPETEGEQSEEMEKKNGGERKKCQRT
jgi:hypothetical protein